MDWEYDKQPPTKDDPAPEKYFMTNPYLYTLGMQNKSYSLRQFL